MSLCSFVAANGTLTFNAVLPENKSLIGHASITVLISNHLKHRFDLNGTGDLRINVTMTRVRGHIVAVEKQKVLHILSVFVALFTQHAQRMRHILLSSVTCLALPYFSHVIS